MVKERMILSSVIFLICLGILAAADTEIYDSLNVSGNVSAYAINVTEAKIRGITNCDTIDTDSTGFLSCGTDDSNTSSEFWAIIDNGTINQTIAMIVDNGTFPKNTTGWANYANNSNLLDGEEATAFQDDVGSDCSAGNYVYGVQNDGTLLCRTDVGGAGASKWIDNGTYLTPNVSFANSVNLTEAGAFLDSLIIYIAGVNLLSIIDNGTFVPYTGATKNVDLGSFNFTIDTNVLFVDEDTNRVGIGQIIGFDPRAGLSVTGDVDLTHTATESDDHAMEIIVNAAGFGDVKGVVVDYITGAVSAGENEEAILINIDESLATGGNVIGLEILTTEGSAKIYGIKAGALVNPIVQLSGVFANMDSATIKGIDNLANFTATTLNATMFVADNDNVTIGDAAKFEEIEFLLETVASNPGIKPTFEYSNGSGVWVAFSPTDGTEGMRTTGVIAWDDANIPDWSVGAGSEYLIRINRTQNALSTVPVERKVQISATTKYEWDKDGYLIINGIRTSGNITPDANNTNSVGNSTDYFGLMFSNILKVITGYFNSLYAVTLYEAGVSLVDKYTINTTGWTNYANNSGTAGVSRGNTSAEMVTAVGYQNTSGWSNYANNSGTAAISRGNTSTEIWIIVDNGTINQSIGQIIDNGTINTTIAQIMDNGTLLKNTTGWANYANVSGQATISRGNTTAEIQAVATQNTTGWANYANDSGTATVSRGNTTSEIWGVVDNNTFLNISGHDWNLSQNIVPAANLTYAIGNATDYIGKTFVNIANVVTGYFGSLYGAIIYEAGTSLTSKYLELTDSFGGDVTGTYDNLAVQDTQGLDASNITTGEIPDARIADDITISAVGKNITTTDTLIGNLTNGPEHNFTMSWNGTCEMFVVAGTTLAICP